MIKAMKRRFMWVSMTSFTLVLLVLLLALNIFYGWQSYVSLDRTSRILAQEQSSWYETGTAPLNQSDGIDPIDKEATARSDFQDKAHLGKHQGILDLFRGQPMDPYANRFFTIFVNEDQEILAVDASQIYGMSEAQITNLVSEDLSGVSQRGWNGIYRYYRYQGQTGATWVYVDATQMVQTFYRLVVTSLLIFIASLSLVYFLLRILSNRAIQPLLDNIQRQREFISNASHEIKTPLAVLSTNNDVLEMTGQKNEWTASNHRQINRLNHLVEQMLLLARFDEGKAVLDLQAQDIVPAIQLLAADINALAQEQGKHLELELPESLVVVVDKASFQQLLMALIENAIKYHVGNKPIQLKWQSDHRCLCLINECEPMTQAECNQLFDRFYRRDSARNRSQGGSGMGLSIAQSLAQANLLHLTARLLRSDLISFEVQFNKKIK